MRRHHRLDLCLLFRDNSHYGRRRLRRWRRRGRGLRRHQAPFDIDLIKDKRCPVLRVRDDERVGACAEWARVVPIILVVRRAVVSVFGVGPCVTAVERPGDGFVARALWHGKVKDEAGA